MDDEGAERAAGTRLAGTWRSELGSELTLVEGTDGARRGSLRSAVGGTGAPRALTGSCVRRADGSAVIGFAVGWPSTDSLATWTGRYRRTDEEIAATWLLESGAADPWRATHLGCDVFRRTTAVEKP